MLQITYKDYPPQKGLNRNKIALFCFAQYVRQTYNIVT